MKTAIIAGCAALFLVTGTAHANDKLPGYMLGRWCYGNEVSTEAQQVYFPPDIHDPKRSTCSDLTDGINIDEYGYDEESPSDSGITCRFEKIKQRGESTYLAYVRCIDIHEEKQDDIFAGQEEFQLINGLLFKKRMPQG
jgi:hypothetical protein